VICKWCKEHKAINDSVKVCRPCLKKGWSSEFSPEFLARKARVSELGPGQHPIVWLGPQELSELYPPKGTK
jgi:hypothetical protein